MVDDVPGAPRSADRTASSYDPVVPSVDPDDEPADRVEHRYVRHESQAQRLDRNYNELLQELRVAQAGVQILFAFLLTIAFQPRFAELDTFQEDLYLVTLIMSAVAVVCFVAPVSAHRLLFRRGVKDSLVAFTGRIATAGLVLLGLSVLGGVMLVVDWILNLTAALILTGGLLVLALVVWVVIPISLRDRD
jgi:hypothetical protein